jgi:hypothetical protein
METINFWIIKGKEKTLLKVIEWAHRQKIDIEKLSHNEMVEALQTHLRDSIHSN